jgi:hypothetical protein
MIISLKYMFLSFEDNYCCTISSTINLVFNWDFGNETLTNTKLAFRSTLRPNEGRSMSLRNLDNIAHIFTLQ